MPYIAPDVVAKAREMDLLTYLQNYEPNELVHFGGNTYCTREHDSLKISNGKWYWFSRGIGGYNALDYLIKVKEMPFMEAVETIMGHAAILPPIRASTAPKKEQPKVLLLPHANPNTDCVISYLAGRGIDREVIQWCIQTGRLYESYPYHNVVFVGLDKYNKARYGNLRGCGTDYQLLSQHCPRGNAGGEAPVRQRGWDGCLPWVSVFCFWRSYSGTGSPDRC